MREYGKRKYVPERCPDCGSLAYVPTAGKELTLSDFLKVCYTSYKALLRKNSWGIWRWFGYCPACALSEELGRDMHMWRNLVKSSEGVRELRYTLRTSYSRDGKR